MLKKGLILPFLLILALFATFGYILYSNFSKQPNSITKEIAADIAKYPNAISWQIDNSKRLCATYLDGCTNVPSVIRFKADDQWPQIYAFYRSYLSQGWVTTTQIYTAVPNEFLFTNDSFYDGTHCDASLGKQKEGILPINKPDDKSYEFSVVCFKKGS